VRSYVHNSQNADIEDQQPSYLPTYLRASYEGQQQHAFGILRIPVIQGARGALTR
jgi:hypothetical protein